MRGVGLGLIAAGGLIALVLSLLFWRAVLGAPAIEWPMPTLLLVEWTGAGVMGLLTVYLALRRGAGGTPAWLLWGCAGALVAVGAMAPGMLGFYVLPTVLAYTAGAVLFAGRNGRAALRGLAFAILVGSGNFVVLFVMVRTQLGLWPSWT